MKNLIVRGLYGFDAEENSNANGFDCNSEEFPSLTQQSFKEEVDINEIVRRFGITGQVPESFNPGVFGDFTGVDDFHESMNKIAAAQQEFMQLPAAIRERFGNDPGKMLEFLSDSSNKDEAVKLGLVALPPEKTRDVVQAVDELAAKIVAT